MWGRGNFCYKQGESDISFSIMSKKIIIANIYSHLEIKVIKYICKQIPHHRNCIVPSRERDGKQHSHQLHGDSCSLYITEISISIIDKSESFDVHART